MQNFDADVVSPGHAYSVGEGLATYGGDGTGMEVDILSLDQNGGVRELEVTNQGNGYAEGNVLVIAGPGDATFRLRAASETPAGSGITPWLFVAVFGIVIGLFILRKRASMTKNERR